jgi:antirestriction protein
MSSNFSPKAFLGTYENPTDGEWVDLPVTPEQEAFVNERMSGGKEWLWADFEDVPLFNNENQPLEDLNKWAEYLTENNVSEELLQAMDDNGYFTDDVDEAIDFLETGDYLVLEASGSDYALGQAAVDEFGLPSNPERWLDEEAIREYYDQTEDYDENYDEDDQVDHREASIDSLVEEEIANIESGHAPERAEEFFDYESYGRDLRIGDGYSYYGNDTWIAIQ